MTQLQLKDTFTEESNVSTFERSISAIAAAALITKGIQNIKHPGAVSWFLLATGSLLLYRSIAAFSPLKELFTTNPPKG